MSNQSVPKPPPSVPKRAPITGVKAAPLPPALVPPSRVGKRATTEQSPRKPSATAPPSLRMTPDKGKSTQASATGLSGKTPSNETSKTDTEPKTPKQQQSNANNQPKPAGFGYVGTPLDTPQEATQPLSEIPTNRQAHPLSFGISVKTIGVISRINQMTKEALTRAATAPPAPTAATQGQPDPAAPVAATESLPVPATPAPISNPPAPPAPTKPMPVPATPAPVSNPPTTPAPTAARAHSTRTRKAKRPEVGNNNNTKTQINALDPFRSRKIAYTGAEVTYDVVYGKNSGLTPTMINVEARYEDGKGIEIRKSANKARDGVLVVFTPPTKGNITVSVSSESHDFGMPLEIQVQNLEETSPEFLVSTDAIMFMTTLKPLNYVCSVLGLFSPNRNRLPRAIPQAQQYVIKQLKSLYSAVDQDEDEDEHEEPDDIGDKDAEIIVDDDNSEDTSVLQKAPVISAKLQVDAENVVSIRLVQVVGSKFDLGDRMMKLNYLDKDSNPFVGFESEPQFRVYWDTADETSGLTTIYNALLENNIHGAVTVGSDQFLLGILGDELLLCRKPSSAPPKPSVNKTGLPSPVSPLQEVIINSAKPADKAFRRFQLNENVARPATPASLESAKKLAMGGISTPAPTSPKFLTREDRIDNLLADLADLPLHKKRAVLDVIKMQSEILIERFEERLLL